MRNLSSLLRLSDYRRMTIDIELLLAGHPLLFLGRKSQIEGFNCGCILTAIGGGAGDIHPLFAIEYTGDKLTDKKRRREVTVYHKTDILLFTTYKPSGDIVAGGNVLWWKVDRQRRICFMRR